MQMANEFTFSICVITNTHWQKKYYGKNNYRKRRLAFLLMISWNLKAKTCAKNTLEERRMKLEKIIVDVNNNCVTIIANY